MNKHGFLFIFSFFITNIAWAGLGPVNITENTADSEQQGRIFAQLPTPLVSIEPSGSGQIVFLRSSNATSSPFSINKIYAQPINQSNQLQTPVLLVEIHEVPLLLNSLRSANNGNAILHYIMGTDQFQSWTIYYDAQSGWQRPIQLDDNPFSVQLYVDSAGTAYALVKSTENSLIDLYQYQANNSWTLVSEAISDSEFGMGANDQIYRIFNGDTPATSEVKYLSFFNTTNNQWQAPIVINQDANNNVIEGITVAGVNTGGDIFTLHFTSSGLAITAANIRKYEADTQTWSPTPDTLDLPIINIISFALSDFTMGATTNGSASFVGVMHNAIDPEHSQWISIHYSEQDGWQETQLVLDLLNGDEVQSISKIENRAAPFVGGMEKIGYVRADTAGNALLFFCSNVCTDAYVKIFNPNTGWSDKMHIPALSEESNEDCTIDGVTYSRPNPNAAVHSNGSTIITSEYATFNERDRRSYFVTVTGDILSAFSDTTCPFDNSNQEPTDPGTTDPGPADPGTTDPTPGGDSGGTNPGTDSGNGNGSSGGSTGGDSGGSLSLPLILLFMLLSGLRFRSRFQRKHSR